ncbi:unnamed protein product [Alopecurus aequalis]
MGSFFYGGRFCFYMPSSSDNSQQPRSADALDKHTLLRGMEEGVDVRPEPPPNNTAAWRYFKIFCRCFTAAMSIALIVYIFVLRYFNLDPDMQDPYKMVLLLIISLAPVGYGFMITQGDVETQEEAHL